MKRCVSCRSYTLADVCDGCGDKAHSPHPPKFSPEDRYGKYRRRLKKITEGEES